MVPCSKSSLLIRLSKSRCFTCLLQHLYLLQFVCLFNLSLLFFAHVSLSFALGPSISQVDMEREGGQSIVHNTTKYLFSKILEPGDMTHIRGGGSKFPTKKLSTWFMYEPSEKSKLSFLPSKSIYFSNNCICDDITIRYNHRIWLCWASFIVLRNDV